jgi:hypothetical protein
MGHFKTAPEAEEFIKTQLQAWHEVPKVIDKHRARGWGRTGPATKSGGAV